MQNMESSATTGLADRDRQVQLLPGVSRTFALTIPQLPEPLRTVVTNAYLLCRIADTIEDDAQLTPTLKAKFHARFCAVLSAELTADAFVEELIPLLATDTPAAELELMQSIPAVIRCFHSFTSRQKVILQTCVNTMSIGMPEFQNSASLAGLENMASMDRYCYFVAGVVGEMLTELFCDYSPKINQFKPQLLALATSFGQGLQMTNILKDFWDDRQRGVCWLPRDLFQSRGIDLSSWVPGENSENFSQILQQLVAIAHQHLENALQYTLLIPAKEIGIRRFNFWAIGLAVLTLRNIHKRPQFRSAAEVKVNRHMLNTIILLSNQSCHSNRLLNYLFSWIARDLDEGNTTIKKFRK
jgi:farnesyl-diphosphate farnesyltransferase